jgi:hypothetical protein
MLSTIENAAMQLPISVLIGTKSASSTASGSVMIITKNQSCSIVVIYAWKGAIEAASFFPDQPEATCSLVKLLCRYRLPHLNFSQNYHNAFGRGRTRPQWNRLPRLKPFLDFSLALSIPHACPEIGRAIY